MIHQGPWRLDSGPNLQPWYPALTAFCQPFHQGAARTDSPGFLQRTPPCGADPSGGTTVDGTQLGIDDGLAGHWQSVPWRVAGGRVICHWGNGYYYSTDWKTTHQGSPSFTDWFASFTTFFIVPTGKLTLTLGKQAFEDVSLFKMMIFHRHVP